MIGFNGGLIGKDRTSTILAAVGVWTLDEQIKARRTSVWPTNDPKLLTTYPNASAAYSLRLLRDAYTGDLVTVRRASDDVTQGFTETGINNGSLASFCAGTNGFVTTWYDQSGNSNNATQTTTANQAQIVTSGSVNLLNGKPCITYGNSGNSSLDLAVRITDVISVFEVLNIASSQLNTAYINFLLGDTTNFDYHGAEGVIGWIDPTFSAAVVRNGANRINNASVTLTTAARTSNQVLISMIHTGSAVVSKLTQDRTSSVNSIRGNMQEIILYNASQSANVDAIAANINTHYSIYV